MKWWMHICEHTASVSYEPRSSHICKHASASYEPRSSLNFTIFHELQNFHEFHYLSWISRSSTWISRSHDLLWISQSSVIFHELQDFPWISRSFMNFRIFRVNSSKNFTIFHVNLPSSMKFRVFHEFHDLPCISFLWFSRSFMNFTRCLAKLSFISDLLNSFVNFMTKSHIQCMSGRCSNLIAGRKCKVQEIHFQKWLKTKTWKNVKFREEGLINRLWRFLNVKKREIHFCVLFRGNVARNKTKSDEKNAPGTLPILINSAHGRFALRTVLFNVLWVRNSYARPWWQVPGTRLMKNDVATQDLETACTNKGTLDALESQSKIQMLASLHCMETSWASANMHLGLRWLSTCLERAASQKLLLEECCAIAVWKNGSR